MIMYCTFMLLIVVLMLSAKIEANNSTEKLSKENLDEKKLIKRNETSDIVISMCVIEFSLKKVTCVILDLFIAITKCNYLHTL